MSLLRRRRPHDTVTATATIEAVSVPGPDEVLWLDRDNALTIARERTNDSRLIEHSQRVIQDGVTVIRNAIAREVCDGVRDDYRRYCEEHAEAASHADTYGKHTRLGSFHVVSHNALRIGTDAGVMRLLDFLFGYRASVYTSLTFEKSTQQKIHRDSPFFHTIPVNYFAGVWTALEDIDDRAGPLEYYPGGHRFAIDPVAIGRQVKAEAASDTGIDQLNGTAYNRYIEAIHSAATAAGSTIVRPEMRKGDTLIWHPCLPHGGGEIVDHSLTRASIVFHCSPIDVQFYGPDVFFGFAEPKPAGLTYRTEGDRKYVDQSVVQFYPDL